MRILDRIRDAAEKKAPPCFSFEFFPPKTPEGERNLYAAVESLKSLQPGFVSVTYGARDRHAPQARERHRGEAHFTCVGHIDGPSKKAR